MLVFDYELKIDSSPFLKKSDKSTYRISEVEIGKSVHSISNYATIKLGHSEKQVGDTIKVGSRVELSLGYEPNLNPEFSGYITAIIPEHPFTIVCEDEGWKLKRENISKSWVDTGLKQVIKDLFENSSTDTVHDVKIKSLTLKDVTKFRALEKIKEAYGLTMYFRNDGSFFAGIPLSDSYYLDKEAIYAIRSKMSSQINVIKLELKYKTKDSIKLKVRAVSLMDDGTKLVKEFGDEEGGLITLHFINIKDEETLKKLAEDKLQNLKYDGYEGSFKTFGIPYVEPGYTAELRDYKYPKRSGRYYVEEVNITASKHGGFRRNISLGRKIS